MERFKKIFHDHVKALQDQITQEMKRCDPSLTVTEDQWQRLDHEKKPGGGGITRSLKGKIFESAGVNTSCVFGKIDPQFAAHLNGQGDEMWAAGISLILHPYNPRIPTVHANFRFIEQGGKWWFGGGADLTPYYPHEEDFRYFHQTWKKACDLTNSYEAMKAECDRYFVNHHREGEMRGIGGIFFDHYSTQEVEKDLNMVMDLSASFIPSYFPLVSKRKDEAFTLEDEDFQLHRRGRYVEFNLLHDRGTLFGLKTNGRVDSILISLPARCKFTYSYRPKENSPHAQMMSYYRPQSWA
jgi:coproporphyrinogen III oxidase